MAENANHIERAFVGEAYPITYFFAGFIGSQTQEACKNKNRETPMSPQIRLKTIGSLVAVFLLLTTTSFIVSAISKPERRKRMESDD
ncbi:hypothetical protein N8005_01510 [Litorivicinus sp.]|nr:hypothetical protein [Litorivicinus sp.]